MKTQIKESTLLPEHYRMIDEPFYEGKGNHNVIVLEKICEQQKEVIHLLRIREQSLLEQLNAEIIK